MAEIFGAVASGAGLISLAIQLLESSQKLKSFYNASKDAPQTVADLSFELETMSMSLRQLVVHRQADLSSDTLLGRCATTCSRMTTKIQAAVVRMEQLLHKSRGMGRMYSAFKEPEIRKLLEELEHAKSSMLFAYMSYCQSWNIREASTRAAQVQLQNALLSSHETQLENLNFAVQTGHATIIEKIETSTLLYTGKSAAGALVAHGTRPHTPKSLAKRRSSRTFRLALPRWFSTIVWEFAIDGLDQGWNFSVRPVNVRQYGSFAFDVIQSGDVQGVKKLLVSGQMSVSDQESFGQGFINESVLEVAAQHGCLELCEFLLHEFPALRSENDMHRALKGFLRMRYYSKSGLGRALSYDQMTKAFYALFLGKYGLSADLRELIDTPCLDLNIGGPITDGYFEDIGSNGVLTREALQEVIASQIVPFNKWPPEDRFYAAVNSRGWPAKEFLKLIDPVSDTQLVQWADPRGKTALHWAAEHFGCWMAWHDYRRNFKEAKTLRREYGWLCTKLIAKGANPHALTSANETPFTCMLQALRQRHHFWARQELYDAVLEWGNLIQEADISLDTFVEMENLFLSESGSTAANLCLLSTGSPWTYKLTTLESSTLAIEMGHSLACPLWLYCPPPGTWGLVTFQINKMIWLPSAEFEGDDWPLWKQAEDVVINSPPVVLRAYQAPMELSTSVSRSWMDWVTGSQDDHGFVAASFRQRESDFVSGTPDRRRRAASLPPPITMPDENHCPVEESHLHRNRRAWMAVPHKCPLDLTWKSTYRLGDDQKASRRRCMQGRCDDDGTLRRYENTYWECKLLYDEENVEIARRFTDRFRPHWRHIVEENHQKALRRAELGISNTGR